MGEGNEVFLYDGVKISCETDMICNGLKQIISAMSDLELFSWSYSQAPSGLL